MCEWPGAGELLPAPGELLPGLGWPGADAEGITAIGWTWFLPCPWLPEPPPWPPWPPWPVGLVPGVPPCANGLCAPGAPSSRAATSAPTATAPAPVAQAAGWVLIADWNRRSQNRSPAASRIQIGSAARHPARRDARTASSTAARCCRLSSSADT